jgi:hypothetical protein
VFKGAQQSRQHLDAVAERRDDTAFERLKGHRKPKNPRAYDSGVPRHNRKELLIKSLLG